MRIALDARTIYRTNRRGTGKNLLDLYRHVLAQRPDWHVTAYHRQTSADAQLLPAAQAQPRRIEMFGDRFDTWGRYRLPLAAWRDGADVIHCPANACPDFMPAPTMVTIHDLIPIDHSHQLPATAIARFERGVQLACRQAATILCPSQYTAGRLIRDFGADPAQITVIPWAADSSMRHAPGQECARVTQRYGISGPFVLHLGAADPRKNTRSVIEAWAMLDHSIRDCWQLLVVGLDDSCLQQMKQTAAGAHVTDSVVLRGFAPDQDLPGLFSAASILAYPSLSEGFGLPILDAWVTATTVLTSNTTSIPEVAGDAALLVDPRDTPAIAAGLARLIENRSLRDELAARGTQRLSNYSWQATAERFIAAVEQAASTCTRTRTRIRAAA